MIDHIGSRLRSQDVLCSTVSAPIWTGPAAILRFQRGSQTFRRSAAAICSIFQSVSSRPYERHELDKAIGRIEKVAIHNSLDPRSADSRTTTAHHRDYRLSAITRNTGLRVRFKDKDHCLRSGSVIRRALPGWGCRSIFSFQRALFAEFQRRWRDLTDEFEPFKWPILTFGSIVKQAQNSRQQTRQSQARRRCDGGEQLGLASLFIFGTTSRSGEAKAGAPRLRGKWRRGTGVLSGGAAGSAVARRLCGGLGTARSMGSLRGA